MPANPKSNIPEAVENSLSERDKSPMGEDAFIKFQMISLMPGIAKNFRYRINKKGELFYAENSSELPDDRHTIFNQPLPEAPTRQLSPSEMGTIQDIIDEVDFFSEPVYQPSKVKDGALMIVTISRGDQVHEVWYFNTHTTLTDLLQAISPTEPENPTGEDQLASLKGIVETLQQQAADLTGKTNTKVDHKDENALE